MLALLLLLGCTDPDGDGLSNAVEELWGSDPQVADTDGDGLDDGAELELGTDPTAADTDEDGWRDGEELAEGTSPTFALSHPFEGGWRAGDCAFAPLATGPTAQGMLGAAYQVGDTPDDFALVDQHGETVHLHAFCGQVVMVGLVHAWGAESQALADEAQAIQEAHGEGGFQLVLVMEYDEEGQPPSETYAADFAAEYGLADVPLLASTGGTWAEPWHLGQPFPMLWVLDRSHRVVSADEGVTDPAPWL